MVDPLYSHSIAKPEEIGPAFTLLKEAALWLKAEGIDYWQNWIEPEGRYADWIRQGFDLGQFYFVRQNGEVIGMYRLQYEDEFFWGKQLEKAGYVHSFTTKRSLRGQGAGRRILQEIGERHLEEGIGLLRLDCGKNVQALCAYYESNGFRNVGEKEILGDRLVLYEKTLTPI